MKLLTILCISILSIFGLNAQEFDSRLLDKFSETEIYEMQQNDSESYAILTYALDNALYYLDVPSDKEVNFKTIRIAKESLNFVDLGLEIEDQNQYFLVEGKNKILVVKSRWVLGHEMNVK